MESDGTRELDVEYWEIMRECLGWGICKDLIDHTSKHGTNDKGNDESWIEHLSLLLWLDTPTSRICIWIPNLRIAFHITENGHREEVLFEFQFTLFRNILTEYLYLFSFGNIVVFLQSPLKLLWFLFNLLHSPYVGTFTFVLFISIFSITTFMLLVVANSRCIDWSWDRRTLILLSFFPLSLKLFLLLHLIIIFLDNLELSPLHHFELAEEKWELQYQSNHL